MMIGRGQGKFNNFQSSSGWWGTSRQFWRCARLSVTLVIINVCKSWIIDNAWCDEYVKSLIRLLLRVNDFNCCGALSSLLMWDFPPLFSPHKSTNSFCLSPSLPLPVPLPPIHVHETVYGKPTELFAPWKNIPLMNLLKHWSDLAQFVQSRFVTLWIVLRSSESSGHGEEITVWNTLQGQIS